MVKLEENGKKTKVLILYCGIGGTNKLWPEDEIEVTAIEYDSEIAKIYQDFFPKHKVIVCDAHQYLLDHYDEFDFIWSSPPCQSHTKLKLTLVSQERTKHCLEYIDMKLYQEIIFLKYWFKGKWVIENVKSYYEPLIKPFESGNHYFWSNFHINKVKEVKRDIRNKKYNVNKWNFNLEKYKMSKTYKKKLINNLVNPELGKHIFDCAFKIIQAKIN